MSLVIYSLGGGHTHTHTVCITKQYQEARRVSWLNKYKYYTQFCFQGMKQQAIFWTTLMSSSDTQAEMSTIFNIMYIIVSAAMLYSTGIFNTSALI